jgi:dATP pyrophosphohydrolase
MRAPFQVIVLPYICTDNDVKVLICRRSDNGIWQLVSGGGEGDETPLLAAKRELSEEAALYSEQWQQLDSMCMLPKMHFQGHENWSGNRYVIPEYALAAEVRTEPKLSNEHLEYRWCSINQASDYLEYDSNKIAVWELGQRLIAR